MSDVSARLDIVSVKISILSTDLKEQSNLSVSIHHPPHFTGYPPSVTYKNHKSVTSTLGVAFLVHLIEGSTFAIERWYYAINRWYTDI